MTHEERRAIWENYRNKKLSAVPTEPSNATEIERKAGDAIRSSGRRDSHVNIILKRLQEGPVTNIELAETTARYGARIYDLRQLGHKILSSYHDSGYTTYILIND